LQQSSYSSPSQHYSTDITQEKINTKAQALFKFTIANALLKDRPNNNRKNLIIIHKTFNSKLMS